MIKCEGGVKMALADASILNSMCSLSLESVNGIFEIDASEAW